MQPELINYRETLTDEEERAFAAALLRWLSLGGREPAPERFAVRPARASAIRATVLDLSLPASLA